MFNDHPLLFKLKKNFQFKEKLVKGIVKKTKKGFCYLNINVNQSYHINSKHITKVMNGDKISAKIVIQENKTTVKPIKLIKPYLKKFIGKIYKDCEKIFILPESYNHEELIICDKSAVLEKTVHSNDWVLAELSHHKLNGNKFFKAQIIKIIAKKNNSFAPWFVTLARYNLENKPPKVNISKYALLDETIKRIDLTDLNFITIDNASTKDIDDAVFIQKNNKNEFVLTIAIADPTAYIPYNSELDILAQKRGFTNYLPGFNVPMLPRELSENICSLKPGMRRPALVCQVNISTEGNVIIDSIKFTLAWIKSKEKLIYKNVSNWLDKIGHWKPKNKIISNQIYLLFSLYNVRHKYRKKHMLIFKNRLEYKFRFNNLGEVINITSKYRRIAHRIIEEVMIIANICAANILSKKIGYGIYNVHLGYDTINFEKIVSILKKYGIFININDINSLQGFFNLNKKLNNLNNKYLNYRIQKLQSYSELSITPKPHFGLGVECYATWTSPIRKYGDIINHRLLKSIIMNNKILLIKNKITSKISNCKRKNRMAEKDISSWLYMSYFKKKIHEKKIFKGEIVDVLKKGMKIFLIQNGASAFIPSYFLHPIPSEIICNKNDGIIYIQNKPFYYVSDIIKVLIIDVKEDYKMIIARPF